jgi:hypothetical protein
MMRLVTLLAVDDIGIALFVPDRPASSMGDANSFSSEELLFPNPSFHFEAFFVTTGGSGMAGTNAKSGDSESRASRLINEALLISRAKDAETPARVSNTSIGEPGLSG